MPSTKPPQTTSDDQPVTNTKELAGQPKDEGLSTDSLGKDQLMPARHHHWQGAHYSELARISTWLFVGVLALMTFMLTAGLQHPQRYFSISLYITLAALPLSLIAYMLGQFLVETAKPLAVEGVMPKRPKGLTLARRAQQLLVVISLLATTGLALSAAHIFFSVPAAAQPATTQGQ